MWWVRCSCACLCAVSSPCASLVPLFLYCASVSLSCLCFSMAPYTYARRYFSSRKQVAKNRDSNRHTKRSTSQALRELYRTTPPTSYIPTQPPAYQHNLLHMLNGTVYKTCHPHTCMGRGGATIERGGGCHGGLGKREGVGMRCGVGPRLSSARHSGAASREG